MAIQKIMCCCGVGLGSSLIMRMNVEKVLKKLGRSDIEVLHSVASDAQPGAADLFVFGADLADFATNLPNKILLSNLMSTDELEQKLVEKLNE